MVFLPSTGLPLYFSTSARGSSLAVCKAVRTFLNPVSACLDKGKLSARTYPCAAPFIFIGPDPFLCSLSLNFKFSKRNLIATRIQISLEHQARGNFTNSLRRDAFALSLFDLGETFFYKQTSDTGFAVDGVLQNQCAEIACIRCRCVFLSVCNFFPDEQATEEFTGFKCEGLHDLWGLGSVLCCRKRL